MFQCYLEPLSPGMCPELIFLDDDYDDDDSFSVTSSSSSLAANLAPGYSYGNSILDVTNTRDIFLDNDDTFDIKYEAGAILVKPSDITGQTLAYKIKSSKDDRILSEGKKSRKSDGGQCNQRESLATTNDGGGTQKFMDEIKEFLVHYALDDAIDSSMTTEKWEGSHRNPIDLLSEAQQQAFEALETSCPLTDPTCNEYETPAAEVILDALIDGHVRSSSPFCISGNTDEASDVSSNDDEVVALLSDGSNKDEDYIIVITDSNDAFDHGEQRATVGGPGGIPAGPNRKKPGRKPVKRREGVPEGKVVKKYLTTTERKERKRRQNVEAARKYRDRKNVEKVTVEMEEDILRKKNEELKRRSEEMELKLSMMRKLMLEIGLIKIGQL